MNSKLIPHCANLFAKTKIYQVVQTFKKDDLHILQPQWMIYMNMLFFHPIKPIKSACDGERIGDLIAFKQVVTQSK